MIVFLQMKEKICPWYSPWLSWKWPAWTVIHWEYCQGRICNRIIIISHSVNPCGSGTQQPKSCRRPCSCKWVAHGCASPLDAKTLPHLPSLFHWDIMKYLPAHLEQNNRNNNFGSAGSTEGLCPTFSSSYQPSTGDKDLHRAFQHIQESLWGALLPFHFINGTKFQKYLFLIIIF